ncbi:AT5G synthase, partial [Acromyrmex heyeri]
MYACSRFIAPVAKSTLVSGTKTYLRPLSSAVINHSQYLQQNQIQTPVSLVSVLVFLFVYCITFRDQGAGIGSVFGSLIIGYARNPSLKQQLFSYAILGFALSEAMGLFCLMMAFLLLFAF